MRLSIFIGIFFFCFLVPAQSVSGQAKALKESKNENNSSEMVKKEQQLFLTDSVYHAGALLFMDLELDYSTLKSTFCLSCHDGSMAGLGHTSLNFGNPSNFNKMRTVLNFDHPVAFEYTKELASSNRSLKDPESFSYSLRGTIAEVLLVDGRVECVTCHNIFFKTAKKERHNILNESVGTLLCLECHNR